MLQYNFHIKDNIGGRKEQQDFAGSLRTADGLLVVVCDGMGGARGGALAARMAVTIVLDQFKKSSNISAVNFLSRAIQIANNEIYTRSVDDPEYKGMGTTITALLLQEEKAAVAHVGDSRVYLLRGNTFGSKVNTVFRTSDHSKVFELVKRGILTEEQARTSEESNIILRALGIRPRVEVDIQDNLPYKKNDIFLLCTDGICGAIPEKLMIELLSKKGDLKIRLNNLVDTINRIGFENGGGHDNMTATMVECKNSSLLKVPFDKSTILKPLAITSSLAVIVFISIFLYSNSIVSLFDFSNETKSNFEIENGQDSTLHKGINNGGTVDVQIKAAKNSNHDPSKGNKQKVKSSEGKTIRDSEKTGKANNSQTNNPSNSGSVAANINSPLGEEKDTIKPQKTEASPVMIPPTDTNALANTTNTNGETKSPKIPAKQGKDKKPNGKKPNGKKSNGKK